MIAVVLLVVLVALTTLTLFHRIAGHLRRTLDMLDDMPSPAQPARSKRGVR